MTPVYCHQCNRANGAAATKCIWCGVPITNGKTTGRIETTRVELGYVDGIERLEDPCPVRLVISADGVEVAEVIPGSRAFKIPASSILQATVVDASALVKGPRVRPVWWWLALGPFAVAVPGKRTADKKEHDYILTIRYKAGAEIRNAVFHREDRSGLAVVEGLARIVNGLADQDRTDLRGS